MPDGVRKLPVDLPGLGVAAAIRIEEPNLGSLAVAFDAGHPSAAR
jgi:hypothetical protein